VTAAPSQAVLDEVVDVRRHLHARPETGFEEHETTRLIRERLAGAGGRTTMRMTWSVPNG